MKIESNKLEPKFTPIEVKMTIESLEELEAIKAMTRRNIQIPELCGNDNFQIIQNLLDALFLNLIFKK